MIYYRPAETLLLPAVSCTCPDIVNFIIYCSAYTSEDKSLQAYNEGWVRIVVTMGNEQNYPGFELPKDK